MEKRSTILGLSKENPLVNSGRVNSTEAVSNSQIFHWLFTDQNIFSLTVDSKIRNISTEQSLQTTPAANQSTFLFDNQYTH